MKMPRLFLLALLATSAACSTEELCDPGTAGCPCLSDATCRLDSLICLADICVDPGSLCDGDSCAPSVPKCFSPCIQDVVLDDGKVLACSDEGLLEGCLGDTECVQGSCIPTISSRVSALVAPGTCAAETDCPDYQTCIQGRCFSNCGDGSECPDTRDCHRHVCRVRCTDAAPCKEEGYACDLSGVCLPLVTPSAPATSVLQGDFRVSVDRVRFSSDAPQAELELVNDSGTVAQFLVKKVEQRVLLDGGTADVRLAIEGDAPLSWMTMGVDAPLPVQSFPVRLNPGASAKIVLGNARNSTLPRWQGLLEISSSTFDKAVRVRLVYSETVKGRWRGRAHYFGNFEDGSSVLGGESPLDRWRANRGDPGTLNDVPNAFIQAWGRFRNNQFSAAEMEALVQATTTGSWQFDRVQQLCEEAGFGRSAVCAPFGGAGSAAVIPYTSAGNINRVPSGVVQMDMVLNLEPATFEEEADPGLCGRRGLTPGSGEHCFVGRIDSAQALQYGGNPAVVLRFEDDPLDCQAMGSAGCVSYLADAYSEVRVGARYVPEGDDTTCALVPGLEVRTVPWLVPGFDPPGNGGGREVRECRDQRVPFDGAPELNVSFAGANPIPDGKSRLRRIELVDGIMLNQSTMQLILRETVDAFHGGATPFVSYAYVTLTKDDADLELGDYQGNRPKDERSRDNQLLGVSCGSDLINQVTRRPNRTVETLSVADRDRLAYAVVTGATSGDAITVSNPALESIHYVCIWNEDTVVPDDNGIDQPFSQVREVFDGGPSGTTLCPGGAQIVYFALDARDFVDANGAAIDPATLDCNQNSNGSPESCLSQLRAWVDSGKRLRLMPRDEGLFANAPATTVFDLAWTCTPPGYEPSSDPNAPPIVAVPMGARAECDDLRSDLRVGKTFFAAAQSRLVFNPIETDIHQAFRYRTQFVSRSGRNVGFAPEVCRGDAGLVPYCYDPDTIKQITERVDCALALYHFDLAAPQAEKLPVDTAQLLLGYLTKNFGVLQIDNPLGDPILQQGFERLFAELAITLGDDAYTASLASRFDLAGENQLAFEGTRFEVGGIDLSGGAGFELYKLYQAAQFYELVLDRFYRMTPLFWSNLEGQAIDRYITQQTVTSYLNRIIRASAQLANTQSEIARRYQLLNRPDLARRVVERGYTRAYQESLVISSLMGLLAKRVSPSEVDQIIYEIEQAQRRYRVAMLGMQTRYQGIDDSINAFGFLPDYIPFPALDEGSLNGFVPMFERAMQRLEVAGEFEARALESSRAFDVDEAAFQNELVQLTLGYQERLGELCGTFTGSDGRVYPAIRRYAHLSEDLAGLDDPCGGTQTGALWLKNADIETRALELQRVRTEISNVQARASIATESVAAQCELINEDVRLFLEHQGVVDGYQNVIDGLTFTNGILDKTLDIFTADSTGAKIATGVHLAATTITEAVILAKQIEIRDLERSFAAKQIGRQCVYLQSELGFTIREILLDMNLLELDALNAIWNVQVEGQLLIELDHERQRLLAEWEDAEQLVINAAAAQSDPNVRIYQNDAIINADRWFTRAIRDAYRATKIYEYYTSQSYARQEELYLIRMIDAGQPNLRNYLADLDEAYFEFGEQFGNPDSRIEVLSLRDDLMRIPRVAADGSGRALSSEERVMLFRERLKDPVLLDERGFITYQFSTGFDRLSPLTHNHKILFMEVELFGDVGDDVARVYVRQKGTGVVKTEDGSRLFYAFEPRTAVINPVVNGFRDFGQDSDGAITGPTRSIFRNYRFRERPLVNTNWELILNRRTEAANEDVNLDGLDDIKLYVFYTDFTGAEQ